MISSSEVGNIKIKIMDKEAILDINNVVVKIGDIIRQYDKFYEVVLHEEMLKGKPLNGGAVIYLPNHNEHFLIMGVTLEAANKTIVKKDEEIARLKADNEKYVGTVEAMMDMSDELIQLREWKESAIKVTPDMQAIGKALGVKLGDSVHDKILPGIERLKGLLDSIAKGEKMLVNRTGVGEYTVVFKSGHDVKKCYEKNDFENNL